MGSDCSIAPPRACSIAHRPHVSGALRRAVEVGLGLLDSAARKKCRHGDIGLAGASAVGLGRGGGPCQKVTRTLGGALARCVS